MLVKTAIAALLTFTVAYAVWVFWPTVRPKPWVAPVVVAPLRPIVVQQQIDERPGFDLDAIKTRMAGTEMLLAQSIVQQQKSQQELAEQKSRQDLAELIAKLKRQSEVTTSPFVIPVTEAEKLFCKLRVIPVTDEELRLFKIRRVGPPW